MAIYARNALVSCTVSRTQNAPSYFDALFFRCTWFPSSDIYSLHSFYFEIAHWQESHAHKPISATYTTHKSSQFSALNSSFSRVSLYTDCVNSQATCEPMLRAGSGWWAAISRATHPVSFRINAVPQHKGNQWFWAEHSSAVSFAVHYVSCTTAVFTTVWRVSRFNLV